MLDALSQSRFGRSERPPAVAQGTLEKRPLVHLLLYSFDKKLTGTLELEQGDHVVASILFADGFPVKIRTEEPVAYLGRVLADLAIINDDQLNQSLTELSARKQLHGEILRQSGALTEQGLLAGLKEQLVRKVRHVCALAPETQFSYYDQFDALASYGGPEHAPADPLPIVWASIREAPPWEQVHNVLTKAANSPLKLGSTTELARFGFDDREKHLLDLMRVKPMRMSEIAATEALRPREGQLLVYCLLITKLLHVVQEVHGVNTPSSSFGVASHPASQADPSSQRPAPASGARRSPLSIPPGAENAPSFSFRAPNSRPSVPPGGRIPSPYPPGGGPIPSPIPSPIPPSIPPIDETVIRRTEIMARAGGIDREDYFEMLGISREATVEEVKEAFFALAKTWHPDRLPSEFNDVRDSCARVFSRMSEAHQTLTDSEKRTRYMRLLAEGGATPEAQATIANVVEAATNFQKAEICFKRNDFAQAEMLCRKAHEADPNQPDYMALFAWLESMKPENQKLTETSRSLTMLSRAIQLNDRCERAYFYRGLLNKRLGNLQLAARDFRRVVELNPRNIDAAREIRLYDMRNPRGSTPPPGKAEAKRDSVIPKAPKAPSGGFLGKLFKK